MWLVLPWACLDFSKSSWTTLTTANLPLQPPVCGCVTVQGWPVWSQAVPGTGGPLQTISTHWPLGCLSNRLFQSLLAQHRQQAIWQANPIGTDCGFWKTREIPTGLHHSREPIIHCSLLQIYCTWGFPQFIFRSTNHITCNTIQYHKPCLILHQEFYSCHVWTCVIVYLVKFTEILTLCWVLTW